MNTTWPHKKLEEVLVLNRSGFWGDDAASATRPIPVKVIRNADITKHNSIKGSASRYFSAKEVTNAELQIGDIAMSSSGDVGKAWLVNEAGYSASNFIRILRPDSEMVLPSFLKYVLESAEGQSALASSTAGTTIQNLQKTFYSTLAIPLPPLPEQQRIVRLLDEAFEGITVAKANAEKNLHNSRALFESVLQATFTQHGAGWNTATLADSCEMYQPKTISKSELLADGAYPVYGANGVIGRYNQFNHEEPQLLITCRGATCGAVNISQPFSWITGNAMVVRPKMESLEVRFLEYVFRGGIDVASAITGTAQPQITRASLSPLVFSYPTSPNEQLQIVAKLDGLTQCVEELGLLFTRKSDALKELTQTILHQALTGSLKVA